MKTNTKVNLIATLYSIIIGLTYIATKTVVMISDPVTILSHRYVIAMIGIGGYILISKNFKFNKKTALSVLPSSFFFPVAFYLLQAFGLKTVPSSEAGIIFSFSPVLTLILASLIIKEKNTNLQKIGIFLSVSGILYIFISKGFIISDNSLGGLILVLLSVISLSLYGVLARRKLQKIPFVDVTFYLTVSGVVWFNLLYLLINFKTLGNTHYFEPFTNFNYLLSILFIGLLTSVIATFLWNYSLSKISATRVSVYSNLSTLISIIAGIVVLREHLYYYHFIGTVVIIGGMYLANWKTEKNI